MTNSPNPNQNSASRNTSPASRRPHSPFDRWTFVTEAHYRIESDARVVALDGVSGDSAMARYAAESSRDLWIVGRASQGPPQSTGDVLTVAKLHALPEYKGVRGLVMAGPRVCVRIFRAIRIPGLVILRLPGPLSSIAALASLALRRPYAVELVGDIEGVLRAGVGSLPNFAIWGVVKLTRFAVDHAAAVRYVTEESLQRSYPSSAPRQVGFSDVQIDPAEIKEGRRSYSRQIRIISIGSQANLYKGHQDIIEATRILRERGLNATLVLVGDGAAQPALIEASRNATLSDAVTFAGSLGRVAIFQALGEATVYVQASYTEGLPRAVVEAMSQALPVVGTSVGGIPELVASPFLVEPGDAIALANAIATISSPGVWEEESARSSLRAQDYSQPRLAKRFEAWLTILNGIAGR